MFLEKEEITERLVGEVRNRLLLVAKQGGEYFDIGGTLVTIRGILNKKYGDNKDKVKEIYALLNVPMIIS